MSKYLKSVQEAWGIDEVALQSKGCPAGDFRDMLEEEGWTVHAIEGSKLGSVAGSFKDAVLDGTIRHTDQRVLTQQLKCAVTRKLGEVDVWTRRASQGQISAVIAASEALWALRNCERPKPKAKPSPYPLTII